MLVVRTVTIIIVKPVVFTARSSCIAYFGNLVMGGHRVHVPARKGVRVQRSVGFFFFFLFPCSFRGLVGVLRARPFEESLGF